MGKTKMANPKQIENCKILIKLIDLRFSELDESSKRTYSRYSWADVDKVRLRIEKGNALDKRNGVTLKMYERLESFANQLFGIKISNSLKFID
jgi:hypothetical protein